MQIGFKLVHRSEKPTQTYSSVDLAFSSCFAEAACASAFSVVCDAIEDRWQEESGGSRELSVRAEGDRIIIGYKKELTV